MTLIVPVTFHWSPKKNRSGILRNGLKPTCPTTTCSPPIPAGIVGHWMEEDEIIEFDAVCLGTTPSAAWALSGAIDAKRGEWWDLWQVNAIPEGLECYPQSFHGYEFDEVRVRGRIPKGRIWHVGTRRVGRRRWDFLYGR